jgi:hypothetical protein
VRLLVGLQVLFGARTNVLLLLLLPLATTVTFNLSPGFIFG